MILVSRKILICTIATSQITHTSKFSMLINENYE